MSDFCPCSVGFENIQVKLRIRLFCYFFFPGEKHWFVSLFDNKINTWVQLRVWVAGSGLFGSQIDISLLGLGLGLGSPALDGN